jgi:hypothetical protein
MAGTGCRLLGGHRRRLIRISGPGRQPGQGKRRHRKRRPDTSLPRLTDLSVGRGWEKAGFGLQRAEQNETAQGSRQASREGGPLAPGRCKVSLTGGARVTAPSHFFHHHGPVARAPRVRNFTGRETAPNRRRFLVSRAGFWCGLWVGWRIACWGDWYLPRPSCRTPVRYPAGERLRAEKSTAATSRVTHRVDTRWLDPGSSPG